MATADLERQDIAAQTEAISVNLLTDVHVDLEMNSRLKYNDEKMEELKSSIEACGGIIEPIIVCHTKPGTKVSKPYTLVAGFRRTLALLALHKKYEDAGQNGSLWVTDIPAMNLVGIDSSDYHAVQAIENVIREDLNPIEFAQSIERAMEDARVNGNPMTQAEYAARTGLSQSKVSQYCAVGRLDKQVLELVSENKVPFKSALIIATTVPTKFHRSAAKAASTMSAVDFEVFAEKKWGKANIESAQQDATATAQKIRKTKPAKEIQEVYIPELNKRIASATDEATKQRLATAVDALNFFMNVDGTQLGKDLIDFEKARDQAKLAEHAAEEQGKALTRLKNTSIGVMRGIVNKHVEPGERRPTVEEALLVVKENITKDYNAETKTIKVPAGKESDGAEKIEYTELKLESVDSFMQTVLQAWNKAQADAKNRALKAKQAKQEAQNKLNANAAAPAAVGSGEPAAPAVNG